VAWARNGKEIWFSAAEHGYNNDFYAVDLNGRRRTLWRNAGTLDLLDTSGNDKVLVMRTDVGTEVMGWARGANSERDLSWLDAGFTRDISRDGHTLLLEESGEGAGENGLIFLRNMNGDPPVRLGAGFPVALSPDGKWVLAYRRDTTPPRPFLVPTGTGDSKWFDLHGLKFLERAAWFSDSQRVLLNGHQGKAPNRSYVLNISDGRLQPLTPEGEWGRLLSPNDKQLLLHEPYGTVFDLSAGAIRPDRRLSPGVGAALGWTNQPDTVWVQETDMPAKISRFNLATGQKQMWKELSPADPAGAVTMAWVVIAPDGRAYAYCYFRVLSELFLLTGLK
jgi:hypothetical protein